MECRTLQCIESWGRTLMVSPGEGRSQAFIPPLGHRRKIYVESLLAIKLEKSGRNRLPDHP